MIYHVVYQSLNQVTLVQSHADGFKKREGLTKIIIKIIFKLVCCSQFMRILFHTFPRLLTLPLVTRRRCAKNYFSLKSLIWGVWVWPPHALPPWGLLLLMEIHQWSFTGGYHKCCDNLKFFLSISFCSKKKDWCIGLSIVKPHNEEKREDSCINFFSYVSSVNDPCWVTVGMRGGGSVEPGLNYLKVGGGHNVVGENTLATTSTQYYWKIFQYQIFCDNK